MGQIMSNVVKKSKEISNITRLGDTFKARSSGCKTNSVEIYGNYS